MRSLHPTVPTSHVTRNGSHWYQIYGKLFPFVMGSAQSKAEAKRAADAYGLQHQANLAAKVGRDLTDHEKLFGTIDRPPAPPRGPQPCGIVANNPDSNPHTQILQRLRRDAERPLSPAQRDANERRLKMYERLEAEWNVKHAAQQAAAAADQGRPRAIEHARIQLELAQRNPDATPEDLWAAEDRLKAVEGKGTVADYWQACQAAGLPCDATEQPA